MQIALGNIMDYYPDGTSHAAYTRIGRLIRAHGHLARIAVDRPGEHDSLAAALDRADRGMVNTTW